ncbi:thiamine pyrophosphate-dependent enzyme [Bradyrhizobium sp.]|uniref:thiamine pyrophosphate-binding protein n=1 Tax=Bradyrhizobium sp. TaxID=376 RepID=UPI00261E049B|nr:thiamine pyrophosphate-dependent enzyme [Bradyrhizobium sp.]
MGKSDRRRFLKGVAAVAGGATVAIPKGTSAQTFRPANGTTALPSAAMQSREREQPAEVERLTTEKTGSDFMVDVCKTLNLDYIAACPGSTFRGLQESFINYGANKHPEWLTCLHEEVSVGMAHGYAKVAGKPMAAIMHGTVGTQHAAMAIYNAYCDRVPIILFTGNAGPLNERRPGVEWFHSVQDGAATVRDFVKWDDYPKSLQHFAESTVRGYALACAEPSGPVFLVADSKLQEDPLAEREARKLRIPRLTMPSQAAGDPNALREAAKMMVAADHPVIIADRYARSQAAMDNLVELAELLHAPVIDNRSRMNMPNTHYLCQSERAGTLIGQADCILSLEPVDLFGQLNSMRDQIERTDMPRTKADAKVISISTHDLFVHSNYQDFQRYVGADLNIAADAQTTLPFLIEAVQREMSASGRNAGEMRGEKLRQAYHDAIDRARTEATFAWDARPISTARLYMELWGQLQKEDWALVSDGDFSSRWPHRLWPLDKHYRFIGGPGGYGVGYQPVAALGAALAHRDAGGRVVINVEGDGEFNMAPHTLWTAAHHRIPYLTIIQNNRAYHQEAMHIQRMANRHNRGVRSAALGTSIDNPNIDYAKIATGYGALGIGPIEDPSDLAEAFRKGIAAVKTGQPVLIDVITQPR